MNFRHSLTRTALALALVFTATSVKPEPAKAVIGMATGIAPLTITGSIMAAGGLSLFVAGSIYACMGPDSGRRTRVGSTSFRMQGVGSIIPIIGMILLEGTHGPRVDYTDLTVEQRVAAGITQEEYESFDAEREEVATATDTGTANATRANVTSAEEAKIYFEREYEGLSPATRSFMRKVLLAQ